MTQYLMTHDCYDKKRNLVFENGKIYDEGDFTKDLLRQYKEHGLVIDAPAAQTTAAPLKLDGEGKLVPPDQKAKASQAQAKAKKDSQKEKAQRAADKQAAKEAKNKDNGE